MKVNNNIKLVP